MTQKELLYMEDAINHEQNLETIFNDYSEQVEDNELKNFLKHLAKKHQTLGEKLLKVMEDIADE